MASRRSTTAMGRCPTLPQPERTAAFEVLRTPECPDSGLPLTVNDQGRICPVLERPKFPKADVRLCAGKGN